MSKILRSSVCGKLAIMLVIALMLPFITPVYGDDKPLSPVIISSIPGDCKLSVGKGEGMNVGAKGVIVRDDKDIAKFEVTSVEWGYSEIKVSDIAPGESIHIGDTANITNPNKPADGSEVKKSNTAAKALLALLVVGAAVLIARRGGGGGGSAPSTAAQSITLSSQTSSIPADGKSTTTVTANVATSGNAAVPDGTIVQFSSNAGTISPAQVPTVGGKATATLTAGTTAGTATITVAVGGKTATLVISMTPSTGAVGSIELTDTLASVQALGSGGTQTQSIISATLLSSTGTPVKNATVTFSSTLGSVVGTATSNTNGVATTTFSSSTTGQAKITASWAGATASITISVTAGPPYAINVNCSPGAVQCNGQSFATVTATVKDIAGNAVTDGTVVNFSVQADSNGGGNGSITPQARTSGGTATATLFTRTAAGATSNSGTATVVAAVNIADQPSGIPVATTNISNHATQVQFTSLDVAEIHVGATLNNIRGWDMVGNTTTIAAVVYDSHHNPVPDGTAVYFSSDHGMIYGNSGSAGNVALSVTKLGSATATLVSDADGATNPSWNGKVDITTTSGTVTVTSPGLVIFSGPPTLANSSATLNPTTLQSVQDAATITVIAHDVNNNPIVDGTPVTATASKGTVTGSGQTVGGVAMFTLSTSTDATSPTATGPGQVSVSINCPGILPVQFTLPFVVVPPGS